MKKKSKKTNKSKKSNPYLIDDENPEWTDDMFLEARPAREVLKEDFGETNANILLKGKVGRPVSDLPKKQITIRLDADIIKEFRSHGRGWQTEINHILHEWLADRP